MTDLNYFETMRAEMKPDLYDGEKYDQVKPRWWAYAEGDMDSDFFETINLDCRHFPAGTKVIVFLPCCPKCSQDVEMCKADDGCDFDWDEWVKDKYS